MRKQLDRLGCQFDWDRVNDVSFTKINYDVILIGFCTIGGDNLFSWLLQMDAVAIFEAL